MLVFTAGIGEHSPVIRKLICDGLEFLGIRLDPESNEANADVISDEKSQVKVRIIKTNEDLMIARHVSSTLGWTRALTRKNQRPGWMSSNTRNEKQRQLPRPTCPTSVQYGTVSYSGQCHSRGRA